MRRVVKWFHVLLIVLCLYIDIPVLTRYDCYIKKNFGVLFLDDFPCPSSKKSSPRPALFSETSSCALKHLVAYRHIVSICWHSSYLVEGNGISNFVNSTRIRLVVSLINWRTRNIDNSTSAKCCWCRSQIYKTVLCFLCTVYFVCLQVKSLYDNQLQQLEKLIETQRKAQAKMREQKLAADERYNKVSRGSWFVCLV